MLIQDAYLHALQKSEQNLTNGGIKMDKPRFVFLFNEMQNRYVRYILEKRNQDDIRYINRLFVPYRKLEKARKIDNPEGFLFSFPDDFFSFSNVSFRFSNGRCSTSSFSLREVKNEDVNEFLMDANNKPSYRYRETFYTVGDNSVIVYTDGFDVDLANLAYYRYPVQVDIEGYRRSDRTPSKNVDPEFDDKIVDIILNMVEKQFSLNESDLNRFNADLSNVSNLL